MFQKPQSGNINGKSISKDIKRRFAQVLQSLELDLRAQNINRHEKLQKIENEVKLMSEKVNQFSNFLLEDNFNFSTLNDHPLVMLNYCRIIFDILIKNYKNNQNKQPTQNNIKKKIFYNQSNIHEVVAGVKLENFDLREKVKQLQQQLELARVRANVAQEILNNIQTSTQSFMGSYKINFTTMCDLLKKAENNEIELLQNNRFLKEELQSLTIQFDKYKQYFKQGPSLKDKEQKIKYQIEREYEQKLKNTIKQVQSNIKNQLQRSIVQKFKVKNIKQIRTK